MRWVRWGLAGLGLALGVGGAWGQAKVPVAIYVADQGGTALSTAHIQIDQPISGFQTSLGVDSIGRGVIDLLPGSYQLKASVSGVGEVRQAISIAPSGSEPEVIRVTVKSYPGQVLPSDSRYHPQPEAGRVSAMTQSAVAPGATATSASVLVIDAGPGERGVFTAASLAEYPQTKVTVFDHHANKDVTYFGVPLMELLAHLGVPHGKKLMGKPLAEYVVATGSDGYRTVLSLGEVDPDFHPGMVLVADALEGKPLDAKTGPFRLVVTEDRNATRSVRNLVRIEVKKAE